MTSTRGSPALASTCSPLMVSLTTLRRILLFFDEPLPGPLAVRVGEVVPPQVFAGEVGQGVLVLVHVVEGVDGVLEGAAGLDGLVGAGLHAQAAVHADTEVDLVAVDDAGAVGAGAGGHQDAAVGAGLGAGAAAGAALFEPEEVGAGPVRYGADLFRVLHGEGGTEEVLDGDLHPLEHPQAVHGASRLARRFR